MGSLYSFFQNHHGPYCNKDVTMNSDLSASSITDVVSANFLCDNRTMEKIAEPPRLAERALHSSEDHRAVLESLQRCPKDEVATIEGLLSEAAVAEQTRLRYSIAAHDSIPFPPIHSLPVEILSEIFVHYIAISQSMHRDVFQDIVTSYRIHTPILLVCRRWRTTALADPRLWTTIPLIGSGADLDKVQSFAHPLISGWPEEKAAYWKALESRIEQTSALPLRLLFHFNEDGDVGDPIYSISSIQTFIRLFPRANSISLNIYSSQQRIPELTSLMDNAEVSQASRVHTAQVYVANATFARKILSAIPNVEVLEAVSLNLDQWFIDAPNTGHRLRSLHVPSYWSPVPLVMLLDLLDRAPLLETLKLGRISVTPSVGTLRVVTHSLLATFHLDNVTMEESDAIFGHLTLPALRSLSYQDSHIEPMFWPRSSTMAFLRRSGCMLKEFALIRCRADWKPLIQLLIVHRTLISLRLNLGAKRDPLAPSILALLSTKPTDCDRLLPALEVLTIIVLPEHLEAVKRLIQSRSAIQARKWRIAKLREVDIEVRTTQWDEVDKEEQAAMFKEFVNEGIEIRISYKLHYQRAAWRW